MLVIAFFGPLIYDTPYDAQDAAALSVGPGVGGHPLGTDDVGRDLLALMMRGVQRSTFISVVFVFIAGSLGVLVGAASGYFGKYVDNVLMRFVDVILTVPT